MSEILDNKEGKINIFYKKYRTYLIVITSVVLIFLVSLFILDDLKEKRNIQLSKDFYKAKIYLQNDMKDESKELLEKIIEKENIFYSPLSLNLYIENNFDKDKNITIIYFKKIIEMKHHDLSIKDLYKIKLAAYISKNKKKESEILDLLKPIINSNSLYRETAIKFMEQYYLGNGQIEKYKEFSKIR